jgi:hypothetical protein
MVFVQAANEAVAKKTQANPVATRFNMPRFPRVVVAFSLLVHREQTTQTRISSRKATLHCTPLRRGEVKMLSS